MTGSQTAALADKALALPADRSLLCPDREVRLSLPETTMVIIGASGLLWMALYGAFNAFFG